MSTSFPMANPWVDGEGLNAAKMMARVTTPINDLFDAALADTGWISITLASGFITNLLAPAYRVIGQVVYLRGDVKPSTGTFGTSSTITIASAGAIPAGSLPTSELATTKALSGNGPNVINGAVRTDGSIRIFTGTVALTFVVLSSLSGYTADA